MKTRGIGSATGRLDFMGGVADYSGSLVLEMPIQGSTRVEAQIQSGNELIFQSGKNSAKIPWSGIREALPQIQSPREFRTILDALGAPAWTRYVAGSFLLFCRETNFRPASGIFFKIASSVPQSMGVSSSAALEVATLRALESLTGKRFKGTKLARLAQIAENEIVGAPCGLMDQLTCAYGVKRHLLPILCRPDGLGKPVKLPAGTLLVGWPSGVKHAVSASPYASARAASFMGKKISEKLTRQKWTHTAEIAPSFFARYLATSLPESLKGREFQRNDGTIDDPLSVIVPDRDYPIRAAFEFPILENHRCELAISLLRGATALHRETHLRQVGELLYQSHAGYSRMGLGCKETDQMVDAVQSLGAEKGFYGARVSGGGSGGTVVVLLATQALPQLKSLSKKIRFGKSPAAALILG